MHAGNAAQSQGANFTSLIPGNVVSDTSNSTSRTVLIDLLGAGQEIVRIFYTFDNSSCPGAV
jgi:hypothetical protein